MKRKLCRALIALSMTVVLFGVSACGKNDESETFPTEAETTEEPIKESEEETETEPSEEEKEEESTENKKEIGDGEYKIYPAFVTTFTLEDNVLTIETNADVFEDYAIPEEMAINFSYPLADDFEWSDSTAQMTEDGTDWFEWFSFYFEGITMSTDRFNNGQYGDYYTSGEDFCKKNAVWTIVIKDEKVVSISMDLDNADNETSETTQNSETSANTAQESKTSTETVSIAKADETKETNASAVSYPIVSAPTSEPVHEHTWVERYGTIEHEAQGEMKEIKILPDIDKVAEPLYYNCNYCKEQFATAADVVDHQKTFIGIDNDHARSSTLTYNGEPDYYYEYEWVETSPAWTETIVVGYECSTCGATM